MLPPPACPKKVLKITRWKSLEDEMKLSFVSLQRPHPIKIGAKQQPRKVTGQATGGPRQTFISLKGMPLEAHFPVGCAAARVCRHAHSGGGGGVGLDPVGRATRGPHAPFAPNPARPLPRPRPFLPARGRGPPRPPVRVQLLRLLRRGRPPCRGPRGGGPLRLHSHITAFTDVTFHF